MSTPALIAVLLTAGRNEDFEAVAALPGAGNHAQVLQFSDSLRGARLYEIERLSHADRIAFGKALAVYENTVGGLGSVTALQRVLPLVNDEGSALLDWILSNTRSYWYYSHGATSCAELRDIEAVHAVRRAQNEQRELVRKSVAKVRRADKASANLFNAIRRGDHQAVQALLRQGASALGVAPDGVPLAQYAESLGRTETAELLRQAIGRTRPT